MLRQQHFALPFGVRILSRLSSDCVHGGVFNGLPVVCIIDDLNSQLNSLPAHFGIGSGNGSGNGNGNGNGIIQSGSLKAASICLKKSQMDFQFHVCLEKSQMDFGFYICLRKSQMEIAIPKISNRKSV